MAHFTTYDYQTSVVVLKSNDSEYKNGLNEYVKEIMTQSNTIKLNNFGKHYKTYVEVFNQNNTGKLEPNQIKE